MAYGARRRASSTLAWVTVLLASFGALVACSSEPPPDEAETLGTAYEEATISQVWSMESVANWPIAPGSTGTRTTSSIRTQGNFSLQLTSSGYIAVRGAAVDRPPAVTPVMALDVMVPAQAGPYYYGSVQLSFNAPSLGIFSQFVGPKELNAPTGVWQTVYFQLPNNIYNPILSTAFFSDLEVTVGVNTPSGLNQPYRIDNLRFVPAPGCVGVPNGSLCDDVNACTTGNTCSDGVCGTVTPPPPAFACDPSDDVLGFENFPAWQLTNGVATLSPSATRVQGQRSLSITPRNTITVTTIPLATLHKVSSTLSLRVQKPTHQPNPAGWQGDLTLGLSVPSRGINVSMPAALTGQPNGAFFELLFTLPGSTYSNLALNSYNDLRFSITISAPNGQSGFYLLDDLHFVPVTSCAGVLAKTACEDNSVCTQGDACTAAGLCGAFITCDDGNACTDDSCDPLTGCVFTPNGAACDDGNACTTGDRCLLGSCLPIGALTCDDGNGCTDDACDPLTGCVNPPNAAPCDDGNACTNPDVCSGGACSPGAPVVCNDGNVCTDNACDPLNGCMFPPNTAACDDGNGCTLIDVCQNGACEGTIPKDCDDGSTCTLDLCIPPTGTCVNPFACSGVCFNNQCCDPFTCQDLHAECGLHDDGCGGTVDCSAGCQAGGTCNPAFQCLPPNEFTEDTSISVCEILLEDLIVETPVTTDFFECIATTDLNFEDPLQCIFGALSGHWDCCFDLGDCLGDPVCRELRTVTEIVRTVLGEAGTEWCEVRSPLEYLTKILNGSISNLEEWELFVASGGLTGLIEWDIAVLTQAGKQAPDPVRNLVRQLTANIYDGGDTGFSYDDLDDVKIVSSEFPTAAFWLPPPRVAITLGPVVVLQKKYYDALFSSANAGVSYSRFLTDPEVCQTFVAAVSVLVHELVHVKQARELGRVNFYTQYLGSALVNDYGDMRFEEEAFVYEIELAALQGGQLCSVMAHVHEDFVTGFTLPIPVPACTPNGPELLRDFLECP
jgi:hypothetical protein